MWQSMLEQMVASLWAGQLRNFQDLPAHSICKHAHAHQEDAGLTPRQPSHACRSSDLAHWHPTAWPIMLHPPAQAEGCMHTPLKPHPSSRRMPGQGWFQKLQGTRLASRAGPRPAQVPACRAARCCCTTMATCSRITASCLRAADACLPSPPGPVQASPLGLKCSFTCSYQLSFEGAAGTNTCAGPW